MIQSEKDLDATLPDDVFAAQIFQAIEESAEFEIDYAAKVSSRIARYASDDQALMYLQRLRFGSDVWRDVKAFDHLPKSALPLLEVALQNIEVAPLRWKQPFPIYGTLFAYLRLCQRLERVPNESIDGALLQFMNEYFQNWISSNDISMNAEMASTLQVLPEARLERALLQADRFQPEICVACLTPKVIARLVEFIVSLPAKPADLEHMQYYRLSGIYRKNGDRQHSRLTPFASQLVKSFADALQENPSAPQRNIFIWVFVDAAYAGDEAGLKNLAAALNDKSKPNRRLVAERLLTLDPEAIETHVKPLLEAKRKATRESAAEVLRANEERLLALQEDPDSRSQYSSMLGSPLTWKSEESPVSLVVQLGLRDLRGLRRRLSFGWGDEHDASIHASHCYMCGITIVDRDIYVVGGGGFNLGLVSRDAGESFETLEVPHLIRGLRHVLVDGERLYVCGQYGKLIVSSDGGKSFEPISANFGDKCLNTLMRLGKWLWACGDGGAFRSDDGKAWHKVDIEGEITRPQQTSFGAVLPSDAGFLYLEQDSQVTKTSLKAPDAIWAACETTQGSLLAVGAAGGLYRSTNRGESFDKIETGLEESLQNIACTASGLVVAVGKKGVIIRSKDDGASFERVEHSFDLDWLFAAAALEDVVLVGGSKGIVLAVR